MQKEKLALRGINVQEEPEAKEERQEMPPAAVPKGRVVKGAAQGIGPQVTPVPVTCAPALFAVGIAVIGPFGPVGM